jgi:hypothetical protein
MKCDLVVSFVFEEIDRFQTSYLKRQACYLANVGSRPCRNDLRNGCDFLWGRVELSA